MFSPTILYRSLRWSLKYEKFSRIANPFGWQLLGSSDGYIAPIYTRFSSEKGNTRVKNHSKCANNELPQGRLQHFDVLWISRPKLMTEKSSSRKMVLIRVNFSDNQIRIFEALPFESGL